MTNEEMQMRKLCSDLAKLNPTNQFVIKIQAEALLTSQKLEESKHERREEKGSPAQCADVPSSQL